MNLELIKQIVSEPWAMLMVIFFFGASIFVHELGHFLAARWRKLKIERFSIGMGPRLFGWTGKDGVDYRVSALPIGGYVALPQLADMQGVEGQTQYHASELPPISYADKMIVSVAGAVFNVIFALFLASIIWFTGIPRNALSMTTTVGFVEKTQKLSDEQVVESPAFKAGLQPGDNILEVDGSSVKKFEDIVQLIATGVERDLLGNPMSTLKIERDGEIKELSVYPNIVTKEEIRHMGELAPLQPCIVGFVKEEFPAEKAGLQIGDQILSVNGQKLASTSELSSYIAAHPDDELSLIVEREGKELPFSMKAKDNGERKLIGIGWKQEMVLVKVDPFTQIWSSFTTTLRVLRALVHPNSNIQIKNLSGPAGISYMIYLTSLMSFSMLLSLIVLINVNLAVLNLMPIPVLDGGHMTFATIQKLTGRQIPTNVIAGLQSVVIILLFGMMIYVTIHDVDRISDSEKQRLEMNKKIEAAEKAAEAEKKPE